MFPHIMEYSGKNIPEFIHSSCSIGLLRKKKRSIEQFFGHLESLHFDSDCKIYTHFGGERKLFWEEWTPGKDSTLNFI